MEIGSWLVLWRVEWLMEVEGQPLEQMVTPARSLAMHGTYQSTPEIALAQRGVSLFLASNSHASTIPAMLFEAVCLPLGSSLNSMSVMTNNPTVPPQGSQYASPSVSRQYLLDNVPCPLPDNIQFRRTS
ncbi:hypothetical protein PM082_007040 [Marasmius tenuissimus]|nr:hypothetical protein PM082_007040 [Marasmius tenuissimus]